MRVLVLGGGRFVGRSVVAEALGKNWSVTTFSRRGSGDVGMGVEVLRGDRLDPADVTSLRSGRWDVVVDTWAGPPRAVRESAQALTASVGHYVYISSRSVYRAPLRDGAMEDDPVVPSSPDAEGGSYAECKAGGEQAATAAFGDRALLVRAGLILGPYEYVPRLTWWLRRVSDGGRVLAPGPRELPLQYVDVRDLAVWVLHSAERGLSGAFNVVSRSGHTTMQQLLESCVRVTGSGASLHWVDPEVILRAGIEPWNELPIWVPPNHAARGQHTTDSSKALAAGLRCRPAEGTVSDTWAWLGAGGSIGDPGSHPPTGLDLTKERALLDACFGA
jgi:nucleoside-diphosphate-sugar epimerase